VFEASPGGPAEKEGIRAGDVITAVNDIPVASSDELLAQIKGRPVGESVLLDLMRKGMSQRVAVVPAAWPE
jgi:S1-C subfamily serine protease